MSAYDDIVVESQFILASEAAEATAVFIVTDNKGYIDIICSLVSKLVRKLGKRKKNIVEFFYCPKAVSRGFSA